MNQFTPIASTLGGVLIGLSAAGLWGFQGRVAGISGIAGALMPWNARAGEISWRVAFLLGLLTSGALGVFLSSDHFAMTTERSPGALLLAGLLVGVGTRLGGGCTSGHGVCGMSRLSPRSVLATATFMVTGVASVYVVEHLLGGV